MFFLKKIHLQYVRNIKHFFFQNKKKSKNVCDAIIDRRNFSTNEMTFLKLHGLSALN